MKKIFVILAGFSLLAIAGCGSSTNEDIADANVPEGMMAVDLSEQGLPILITVPDSNVGKLEIIPNAQGGADVKVGKNFQMTITEGTGDMAMKKNDITSDAVRKLVKYLVEAPDALAWQWQIDGMEPEFHFYTVVKAGEKSYEVRDVEGEMFSEKAATQMLDAAKSIRPKTAKAES